MRQEFGLRLAQLSGNSAAMQRLFDGTAQGRVEDVQVLAKAMVLGYVVKLVR